MGVLTPIQTNWILGFFAAWPHKTKTQDTRTRHNAACLPLERELQATAVITPHTPNSIPYTTGLCSGGVGSPVRPFARPPDRPETCENLRKTAKIIGKRPKTTKIYRNLRKTTKIALARSPVAKSGPPDPESAARPARQPPHAPTQPPAGSLVPVCFRASATPTY